jgi:hypothetical protein
MVNTKPIAQFKRLQIFVPGVGLIYLKRQYNMGAGFPAKIKLQAETLPLFIIFVEKEMVSSYSTALKS